MKKEVVILELFSGIGGFSKGLSDAGYTFKKHYFSEIDKHAIANFKHNFHEAENIGSVTDVRGSGIERPDIITFGSPCQDFSLDGKRSGMEGQRSSLILEAIRIIGECRPSVFIWENVKGTFSSNDGADFWAIISTFTNIGGYRLEWQLLNTSWFLPQNRERIYLIGHLAERSEPGVFPFTESNTGNIKGSINTPTVRTITAGGHSGGHHSGMTLVKNRSNHPFKQGDISPTITNSDKGDVRIVTNTKAGFEIAQVGDSINIKNQKSKTRRGRIGKGIANTLETQSNQVVLVGTTSARTENKINVLIDNNIRRLTEIEHERLQGYQDNWTKFGNYDGVVKEIPKTQRYKLCGNAVTTNVVRAIAERLKINT